VFLHVEQHHFSDGMERRMLLSFPVYNQQEYDSDEQWSNTSETV
jgi:hypothetical protein